MTDQTAAALAPDNAPYVYRVFLINGLWFDCRSIWSWPLFWNMAKAEGHILTEKSATPFTAVAAIANITDGLAGIQVQTGGGVPPGTTVQ